MVIEIAHRSNALSCGSETELDEHDNGYWSWVGRITVTRVEWCRVLDLEDDLVLFHNG